MRVAVAYETGQPLVLEDLPVPAIGPRDVLVRVTASGICHTDLNVINGLSALPLPIVPGHEGCGIVEETGPEASLVPVRIDLGDAELALLGCGVTTGLGAALNTAAVAPGSSVAVIGCGGVGQSVIQGARIAGAAVIVAVDPVPGRREASIRAGATHAVDPADGDPVAQVRALTSGRGADYSFEAVGRTELMVQAFDMARAEGTVTLVGMPPVGETLTLPAIQAVFSGKRLSGSVVGGAQILRDFPRFIRLAETGLLDLGSMISHRIKLDEINDGLALLTRSEGTRTVVL